MRFYTSNERLLQTTGIQQRLSRAGLNCLDNIGADLIIDQNERVVSGDQTSHIPLLWVALAEVVGLTVDTDGRIIDGPRATVPGL